MKSLSLGFVLVAGLTATGCSTPSLFPPEATSNVVPSEFGVVQAQPDVFKGRVVQMAGRIVGVEESADGYLIRAQELPMQKHPAYGPAEGGKVTPEFAIAYHGKLDPNAVWYGNKLVVVAVAQGAQDVTVDGTVRSEPLVSGKPANMGLTGLQTFPTPPTAITHSNIKPTA